MNTFAPDQDLRRFAHVVAGPRDFVINLLINGAIAWFVFGTSEVVPLAGTESIFKMLLPMAAIESTATSFFGILNGTQHLRKREGFPVTFRWNRWFVSSVFYSVIQGVLALVTFVIAMFAFRWLVPTAVIPAGSTPPIVGVLSGVLAYIVHSRAVIKSAQLVGKQNEVI